VIEFLRINVQVLGFLTTAQLAALGAMVAGSVLLLKRSR
jgi:hypothetical protein